MNRTMIVGTRLWVVMVGFSTTSFMRYDSHVPCHTSFNDSLSDHFQARVVGVVVSVMDAEVKSIGAVNLNIDKPRAVRR